MILAEDEELDEEQGDVDPFVPPELVEVYEINEMLEAEGKEPLKEPT